MGILTYIGNVLTGRFGHWNDANNQIIAFLWERCNQFPEPMKILFQDLIVSSSLLMDDLVGPDKGRKRLINKDPLQITRQQFARMYAILLETLAGMFMHLNPSLCESTKEHLVMLTGRDPDQSRMIQLVAGLDRPDVLAIGCAAWEEIVSATQSSQDTSSHDGLFMFSALLGSTAIRSFKRIYSRLASEVALEVAFEDVKRRNEEAMRRIDDKGT